MAAAQGRREVGFWPTWTTAAAALAAASSGSPVIAQPLPLSELVGVFLERSPGFLAEFFSPALIVIRGDQLAAERGNVDFVENHPAALQLVGDGGVEDFFVAAVLHHPRVHLLDEQSLDVRG